MIIALFAFLLTGGFLHGTGISGNKSSTTIGAYKNGSNSNSTSPTTIAVSSSSIPNKNGNSSTGSSTIGTSTGKTTTTVTGASTSFSSTIQQNNYTTTIAQNVTQTGNITDYVYCAGTEGQYPNNFTYYGYLNSTGILNWTNSTNYPQPLYGASCAINGNYSYCVGSESGDQSASYYAPISTSGFGNWTETTPYPIPFYLAGCSTYKNYIYCVGGGNYSKSYYSYYAPVSSSGIGQWKQTTSYPTGLFDAGCSIYNGRIYCVGSAYLNVSNTTKSQAVYYAPVTSSGIGKWTAATTYPWPFFGAGCSIYNSTIYCVGNGAAVGANESFSYYAPIIKETGAVGNWISTTNYPIQLSNAGCLAKSGYIYCIGDSNSTNTTSTYYAPINATGIGTWNQTTSYPLPFYGASCAATNESSGFYSG